jgi:3-carboxy-cis,cis-muconate cycloisomerase
MRGVFSDRGRLQGILDFEAALARAQARAGVIPATAAVAIAGPCRAELFDIVALAQATAMAGNSAIPIVNELTRLVAAADPIAAHYVHWGATSQDAMDTGLVLQLQQGLDLIEADAQQLCVALMKVTAEHKETPIAGRTWLQHAAPTTFGLKVAGWLCAVGRHIERLRTVRPRDLVLQLGGAAGTLATLGDAAEKTTSLLAEELGLRPAEMPWHSHRDRLVEVAVTLGLLVGSLGKMARDIALMTQSEVAEVAEPSAPGRGGSSSMPQKRNPVGCATVLAAATRVPALVSVLLSAMTQEHERGLGGWQAEWETVPEILLLTSGALSQMRQVMVGLRVDVERMRANLDATRGLIYAEAVSTALARAIGHAAAHQLVERACRDTLAKSCHLQEVVSSDAEITEHLSAAELKLLFDPLQHVRAAARLVDQALVAWGNISSSPTEGVSCPSHPHQHVRAAARLVDQALVAWGNISSSPTEGVSCPSQK